MHRGKRYDARGEKECGSGQNSAHANGTYTRAVSQPGPHMRAARMEDSDLVRTEKEKK